MPTTTNFGWTTPADTDLVKDGAAAIRTLGNGIDTSLIDLKGGTTGQILSKASNTDLDYTWINNDQGDITAVTAGTGITGGGTTGAVTITNDMATTIDAKGDLVVGTGADAYARLAVGTNNQVLTADSTTATGLKWATAGSGGMTLLETLALSGSSTTSSTISGSYKHLQIVVKGVYLSANDTVYLRMNADTGSNYTYKELRLTTSAAVNSGTLATSIELVDLGNNSDVNQNGYGVIHIYRYTDNGVINMWSNFNGYIAGNARSMMTVGIYDNSAAITSITLLTNGATFSAGTAYIYGVS